jgi:phage shock protein A
MSLPSRIRLLFNVKANAALDKAEDPREVLEYAYAQQRELLAEVKRGLIEVATSRRQLEQQTQKLRARVSQVEDQARRALAAGREDLARTALQRKQSALVELEALNRQVTEAVEQERKFIAAEQQVSARVEEFRNRRTALAASYTAAEAQVRVNDAFAGVAGNQAEVGLAIQRAEENIERMRARASAVDALVELGARPALAGAGDPVERELREITIPGAVDAELAALKAELVKAEPPPGQQPALPDPNSTA